MKALRLDDIWFAIRRLRKDTGTTIASVGALACGIGAAVATWALVSAVLLKPVPIEGADRLFQVDEPPPPNVIAIWVPRYTYPVFESIRDSGTFEAIAAVATIVGVLPPGFRGLHLSDTPDLYLPLHVAGDLDHELVRRSDPLGRRSFGWIHIVGRLWPGETPVAAAARLNALNPLELTPGQVHPLALTNINAAAIPELARVAASSAFVRRSVRAACSCAGSYCATRRGSSAWGSSRVSWSRCSARV
jgi:hypothetical protein